MSTQTISDKARELDELRALSALPAWKDRLLPFITKRRDAHLSGGMAKNSTPEKRAEHVEAYHLANDLLAYVADRIEVLTDEIAKNQRAQGAAAVAVGALADPK